MISTRHAESPAPGASGAGRWAALVAAVALAATGCGDSSTGPQPAVPLALSTALSGNTAPASVGPADAPGVSATRTADASMGTSGDVRGSVTAVDGAGNELVLDVAVVLIQNIQLHRQGGEDCGSGDACVATERQRVLLQMPMDTAADVKSMGPVGQIDADVYDELRFELGRVQSSDSAAVDSFPELEGASVLIQGSYNGNDFTFTSDLETAASVTLSPVLDVSESPPATNITLEAPVTRWFVDSSNVLVDPRTADADAIARDLAESFTGFPDADADGEPDQSTPVSGPS